MKVENIKGSLEYTLDQETDNQTSSGSDFKYDNTLMQEQLNLQAKGDVFDPRLMSYVALGGIGLRQQTSTTNTQSEQTTGDLLEYGFNANFLPVKPYPFSVGTSRTDQLVPRAFQSPLRVKDMHDNFNLSLRVPDWPMTFSWDRSDLTQNSDVGIDQYAFERKTEQYSFNLTHDFSDYSRLTFRADLDETQQTSGSLFNSDVKTQRYRLLHYLNFGDNKQNRLDTSFSLVSRKDQFDTSTFDWTENLFLRHSQNFSTFYNTVYSKSTYDTLNTQTLTGLAGFTHQLYLNLTTTAQVYSTQIDFGSTSQTTTRGGDISFNYHRNNPLGVFLAELELNGSTNKTTGQSGTAAVTDELHHADDTFPFTLNKKNIDTTSIVIRNENGETFQDEDYTIYQVGDEVQILSNTFGTEYPNISNGQTLLVSYLYEVTGDETEDTTERRFRIEQKFNNGLSLYVSNQYLDREINSQVNPDLFGQKTDTMTYGAEYSFKRVTFTAEHTDTDSTFQSIKSNRLAARTYWPISSKTSLSGGVSQTWIDTTGDNPRQLTLFKADGKIRTRLSRYLNVSGRTEYRTEDNSDIGPTNGYRVGVSLDYDRASLSIRTGWDTYFLERSTTESDSNRFYLSLIRRF